MSSALFSIVRSLDAAKIFYRLERTRPDTIQVYATVVGSRLEVDVFEDDHVEISCFRGNEGVEGGMHLLDEAIEVETRRRQSL